MEQAKSFMFLAQSFLDNKQPDAAEEAGSRVINLFSERGEQFVVCKCQHLLGVIYQSKGEVEKAVQHCEVALGIASFFNQLNTLVWICFTLAQLLFSEGKFDEAHAHVEHAKLHATNGNDGYLLAHAMELQAWIWHGQDRLEEAKSGALCAVDAFEKWAANDVESVMGSSGRLTVQKK